MIDNEKLSMVVGWMDEVAGLERQFILTFWTREMMVEMTELRNKKIFLRKMKTDEIQEKDLFVGNSVTLLSRKLKVLDYGDEDTRARISSAQEATFALIKPSSMSELGKLVSEIYQNGLTIAKAKQTILTGSIAEELFRTCSNNDELPELVASIIGAPSLAMVLVGENAVAKWNAGLGNQYPHLDQESNQNTIRARFGESFLKNVAHGSATEVDAEREINLFFPLSSSNNPFYRMSTSAVLIESTCCVILPHIVKERRVGELLEAIQEGGFHISALEAFHLDFGKAEEFSEIYKNVVENYGEMVKHLSSGLCFALEICLPESNGNQMSGSSVVESFREYAGPRDPAIAKKIRPNSLRARFGKNVTETAVHCTDLPEDGPLEVEYFFKVLQH